MYCEQLNIDEFLNKQLPKGKEHIQWSLTSMILVIARLLDPSRELYVSEQWYPKTALPDLLGVSTNRVDRMATNESSLQRIGMN